jgi:YVTN family beta-propeller protein
MPADGRYYYCSSIPDGKIVQIDTRTDRVTRVYANGGADHSVSRDGRTLFVWGSTLTAIDTKSGATVGTLAVPTSGVPVVTAGIGWSVTTPDGASLVHVGNPTLFVDIRDRAHMKVVASVPTGASPILANPSPDGRWLWVPNADEGTISVIDTRQRRVVRTIVTGRYMTVTTFDPSGRRVYVAQTTKAAPAPTRGTTLALYFAQMGAAGAVTPRTGYYQSRPGLDTPGEIVAYDARTFRQLPLPPIPQVTVPQFLSAVNVP